MNEEFTPTDPFSRDDPVPDRAVVSDVESSDESEAEDDASFTSPEGDSAPREPMGATPDSHLSPRTQDSMNPPRCSRRVRRGDYDPSIEGLERHPDFQRVNQSLATPKLRDPTFIKDHRDQFTCTFEGRKQTPGQVRRSRKKQAYKARLMQRKLEEANQTLGAGG